MIIGHKNGSIERLRLSPSAQVIKGYPTHTVIGGEFAVTKDDENVAFKTLLGSCVAIMFYDKVKKVKAMNHFLLPKTSSNNDDMKYGLYSVEMMLNEMYKLGCRKENMNAKISGGANIIAIDIAANSIGQRNVEFAMDFCRTEGFSILSNHTRGTKSRIILLTNTFETFIKNLDNNNESSNVMKNEIKLQKDISIHKPDDTSSGSIELF